MDQVLLPIHPLFFYFFQVRGRVSVSWSRRDDGGVAITVSIPAAVELAVVSFRVGDSQRAVLTEGSTVVWSAADSGVLPDAVVGVVGTHVVEGVLDVAIAPGTYAFTLAL